MNTVTPPPPASRKGSRPGSQYKHRHAAEVRLPLSHCVIHSVFSRVTKATLRGCVKRRWAGGGVVVVQVEVALVPVGTVINTVVTGRSYCGAGARIECEAALVCINFNAF